VPLPSGATGRLELPLGQLTVITPRVVQNFLEEERDRRGQSARLA
jgi:hypothetical protein